MQRKDVTWGSYSGISKNKDMKICSEHHMLRLSNVRAHAPHQQGQLEVHGASVVSLHEILSPGSPCSGSGPTSSQGPTTATHAGHSLQQQAGSVITGGSLGVQVRPNMLELQLQGKRKLNPHYLESYRTALQAAMLLPFSRRGNPRERAGVLALGRHPVLGAILAAEGCAAVLCSGRELQVSSGVGCVRACTPCRQDFLLRGRLPIHAERYRVGRISKLCHIRGSLSIEWAPVVFADVLLTSHASPRLQAVVPYLS